MRNEGPEGDNTYCLQTPFSQRPCERSVGARDAHNAWQEAAFACNVQQTDKHKRTALAYVAHLHCSDLQTDTAASNIQLALFTCNPRRTLRRQNPQAESPEVLSVGIAGGKEALSHCTVDSAFEHRLRAGKESILHTAL